MDIPVNEESDPNSSECGFDEYYYAHLASSETVAEYIKFNAKELVALMMYEKFPLPIDEDSQNNPLWHLDEVMSWKSKWFNRCVAKARLSRSSGCGG